MVYFRFSTATAAKISKIPAPLAPSKDSPYRAKLTSAATAGSTVAIMAACPVSTPARPRV